MRMRFAVHTVVGPHIPTVGVVPIIGDQERNPDQPFILGRVYNATPSFSFNKIDPTVKASVVSVVQLGEASGAQSNGPGAGKITFNPFSITKEADVASPSFFQNATVGPSPVWSQPMLGPHEATTFVVGGSTISPIPTVGRFLNIPITPQAPKIEKLNTHRVEK
jgi:hypothetical protein